jgi:diguanylate cyclase (GGDEF)-like protein/PAS domain S-box-containing protein
MKSEFRVNHPEKGEIWVQQISTPVYESENSMLWYGLMFDITERKRMEQALHRGEEEFRTLAANLPVAVIRYDKECRRSYLNTTAARMLRGSETELLGRLPGGRTVPATPEMIGYYQGKMKEVLAENSPRELEFVLDALPVELQEYYEVRFVPEHGEDGSTCGVLAIWYDITGRKRIEFALATRAREFHTLAENFPDVIIRYDRDCRRIYVNNPTLLTMAGTVQNELIGNTPADYTPLTDPAAYLAVLRKVIDSGEAATLEVEMRLGQENLAWYMSSFVPEFDGNGKIVGALMVARDLTEYKRLSESVQESQARYRQIFDNSQEGLYLVDVTEDERFRMVEVNPAFERLVGIPREAMVGKFHEEILPEEMAKKVIAKYRRCRAAGTVYEEELELELPAGKLIYFSTLVPVRNEAGGIVRIVGITRDVTSQKLAQRALLQREQEFRALSENSPDTIMRYDLECRRIYVNPAFVKLIGLPIEDLLGGTPTQYSSTPQALAYENALRHVLQSGEPGEHEYTWPAKGGREIISHFRLIPEWDKDGKLMSVLAIGRDITEYKKAEAALQKNFRRLSVLHQHLEEQAVELEASREQLKFTEAWYRGILHSAPDGMLVIDGNGIIIKVNAQINSMFGYEEGELAGNSIEILLPPDARERHIGKRYAFAASGNSARPMNGALNNLRGYRKDGSEFPVDVSLSRLPDTDGRAGTICAAIRDVTERRHMEDALRTERGLFVGGPTVVFKWKVQQGWPVQYVSPNVANQFGYTVEEFTGGKIPYASIVHPDDLARVTDEVSTFCTQGLNSYEQMYRIAHADGSYRWIYDFTVVGRTPNGTVSQLHGYVMDITRQKLAEDTLTAREQEFRTLVENAPDTIARYDRDCRRTYVNPLFAEMVGGGEAALLGKTPSECPGGPNADLYEAKIKEAFANGKSTEFELNWPDLDGREICSHVRLTVERDAAGNAVSVLGVGRDITELNLHRKRIYQMAFYDTLTSLPNRALFNDRINQMLTDASRHEQLAGVMLLDLDRFKAVNDTLGHAAGDELLRDAAGRLAYCVRGYDTVSRLSGDEFAILLPEVRSGDDLGRVASKILVSFNEPFILEGKEVFVGCSIGIAVYPSDGETADDLLKQADSAMYFAKRSGRNTFRFYSSDLMDSANERLTLETDLRHGFVRGELELYYQPKVRLADGAVIGSEALLRWHHPERGMVPPDKYIPIAEDCGLIVEIGEWVLHNSCRTAAKWNGAGKPLHKVAINLSARQFASGNLVKTVQQMLAETGCKTEWIELEITESLLLDEDGAVLDMLSAFRTMGITIAIDDFGTGYSSLSYLARFPIDTLKIDRSFTSRIREEGHHTELVKAIISIAYSLNQTVVAEGVETAEEAAFLQAHGCHIAQGFLYSKALPKKQFELLPVSFGQCEKIEA